MPRALLTLVFPICPEEGCPAGMNMVSCADRCPRHCSDLQEGIVCQDGQACQPGCRCSEGRSCPGPVACHSGSVGRQVGAGCQHSSGGPPHPQASWSRTVAVCQLSTASVQMPRAIAGPRAAGTRRPATPAPARLGGSPAWLNPAHHLPTVPGAAGQPGVPAAAHVGPRGSRAASGMGLGQAGIPSPTLVCLDH